MVTIRVDIAVRLTDKSVSIEHEAEGELLPARCKRVTILVNLHYLARVRALRHTNTHLARSRRVVEVPRESLI